MGTSKRADMVATAGLWGCVLFVLAGFASALDFPEWAYWVLGCITGMLAMADGIRLFGDDN